MGIFSSIVKISRHTKFSMSGNRDIGLKPCIALPEHVMEQEEIIGREVIRNQPTNIASFISDLLNKMVALKNGKLSVESVNEPWIKYFDVKLIRIKPRIRP